MVVRKCVSNTNSIIADSIVLVMIIYVSSLKLAYCPKYDHGQEYDLPQAGTDLVLYFLEVIPLF